MDKYRVLLGPKGSTEAALVAKAQYERAGVPGGQIVMHFEDGMAVEGGNDTDSVMFGRNVLGAQWGTTHSSTPNCRSMQRPCEDGSRPGVKSPRVIDRLQTSFCAWFSQQSLVISCGTWAPVTQLICGRNFRR